MHTLIRIENGYNLPEFTHSYSNFQIFITSFGCKIVLFIFHSHNIYIYYILSLQWNNGCLNARPIPVPCIQIPIILSPLHNLLLMHLDTQITEIIS